MLHNSPSQLKRLYGTTAVPQRMKVACRGGTDKAWKERSVSLTQRCWQHVPTFILFTVHSSNSFVSTDSNAHTHTPPCVQNSQNYLFFFPQWPGGSPLVAAWEPWGSSNVVCGGEQMSGSIHHICRRVVSWILDIRLDTASHAVTRLNALRVSTCGGVKVQLWVFSFHVINQDNVFMWMCVCTTSGWSISLFFWIYGAHNDTHSKE